MNKSEKILITIAIILILGMLVTTIYSIFNPIDKQFKYKIKTDWQTGYTNEYSKKGNCIYFLSHHNQEIELCGSYTIINLNNP